MSGCGCFMQAAVSVVILGSSELESQENGGSEGAVRHAGYARLVHKMQAAAMA